MTLCQNFTLSNKFGGSALPPFLFFFFDVKNNIKLECDFKL